MILLLLKEKSSDINTDDSDPINRIKISKFIEFYHKIKYQNKLNFNRFVKVIDLPSDKKLNQIVNELRSKQIFDLYDSSEFKNQNKNYDNKFQRDDELNNKKWICFSCANPAKFFHILYEHPASNLINLNDSLVSDYFQVKNNKMKILRTWKTGLFTITYNGELIHHKTDQVKIN